MKEQYQKQVKKELYLPRKEKAEILRDLDEIFASAQEHGETSQQVIARLGTPKNFADSTAEQFGVDNAAQREQKSRIAGIAALVVAAVCFAVYAVSSNGRVPKNAIGQSDAMTTIVIEGAFGFDLLQILPVVGGIAAAAAVVSLIRTIRNHARQQ